MKLSKIIILPISGTVWVCAGVSRKWSFAAKNCCVSTSWQREVWKGKGPTWVQFGYRSNPPRNIMLTRNKEKIW